jgi:hypothetical protein
MRDGKPDNRAPTHHRISAPPVHKAKNSVPRPPEAEVCSLVEDER